MQERNGYYMGVKKMNFLKRWFQAFADWWGDEEFWASYVKYQKEHKFDYHPMGLDVYRCMFGWNRWNQD